MPILDKLVVVLIAMFGSFIAGIAVDHVAFDKYKGRVEGMASAQVIAANAANKLQEGTANEADDEYRNAIQGIRDYYDGHPVVRMHNTCTSRVSKTFDNPTRPDDTATGEYASPYRPADTEQVAVQLNALQNLLVRDGVMIK